ncbi:ABC transporter permease subunit [Candidatus Roizmanbacteria bacterium]|nr:ABC transporter permease subunit [Candidatus Roizmanbacteria bacterium]
MFTLYKKELNYYLNNPIGYIVLALFAVFANFLFVKDIFVTGSASMRPFFGLIPWLFLVFVPALSMRILSEEKRTNTIERLLTLPISESEVVLAKFLSLLSLVAIALFLTFGLPISLSFLTKLYFPEILVGYIGTLFLASHYISLSIFFSSQTKNQVVAYLISAVLLFLLLVLSTDFSASVLPRFAQDFLSYFSPLYHLQNFVKGVIDFRSIIYFVSFTILFLFLTIIDLEKRR